MKALLTILLFLCSLSVGAQTLIKGRTEAHNKILPGVAIELKGTREIEISDANGLFQIRVPDTMLDAKLLVTYGGYEDILVSFRSDTMNVFNFTVDKPIKIPHVLEQKVFNKYAQRAIKKELKKIHR